MTTLAIGDPAPDFTLLDQAGNSFTLSDCRGQRVVVYFYPRDHTPGCTKEACGFRDSYVQYQDQRIAVVGISADDLKSHQKFAIKYQLPFPLLSDPGAAVAKSYGVYGLKKMMGREYEGIYRTTFVISPTGIIEQIDTKIKPELHAADLLQRLTHL